MNESSRRAERAYQITIPVSPGELIDKITILEIKRQNIGDAAKRRNVERELSLLSEVRSRYVPESEELARLTAELKSVNETLWQIEDAIRDCERRQDFGPRFVELARSVYLTNDRRSKIKRSVSELIGSDVIEEKSYTDYAG